ncbi:hypothetical protein F511_39231 [Dorcoceras hygrometricum]|uniref:Uncharacterized protein n=1 Tax=Dorcoceras hygrometricum TaxID=472368 RepID=A0A2Z7DBX0_9LAMI|nr:hypothetical protein F511_39231 [Dorcoceras hygrometricum]
MYSRSLDPVVKRNLEAALMTAAYILEEAINSKYDVSSKLEYIQQSTISARASSAMMTSAVMSSQSAVVKRSAGAGSAMMKSAVTSANSRELQVQPAVAGSYSSSSRSIPVAEYTSRKVMNQSQATVNPVASYSASSRRLQCFAYPVAGNPDAIKADVVKICKPVDKESNAKKQRK